MADPVAYLLAELGYRRYLVSAGDVGCDVAEALAASYPDRVAALHLTDVSQYHFLVDPPTDLSDAEGAYLAYGRRWQASDGGYMHEQSTKPHTLAVGLGDSPAGLAAWLVEKLRSWTDCGGGIEAVFDRDELLTWITAYWVSGAIGTSFTPYAENGVPANPSRRIEVPPPSTYSRATWSTRPASSPNALRRPVVASRTRGRPLRRVRASRRPTPRASGRRRRSPTRPGERTASSTLNIRTRVYEARTARRGAWSGRAAGLHSTSWAPSCPAVTPRGPVP